MSGHVDWGRIVVSWATRRGLSRHAELEIEADRTLAPEEPVPDCSCLRCLTLAAGGGREDVAVARYVAVTLARVRPEARERAAERARAAWAGSGVALPPPEDLAEAAVDVPGAKRSRRTEGDSSQEALPVEEARHVPIREVAARLGLGEPEGRWGEPRVLCPLHDDTNPSLRLREPEGLWYCDPCAQGGDGIRLVEEALGLEFAEAVRWIVDGGAVPVRNPAQQRLAAGRSA